MKSVLKSIAKKILPTPIHSSLGTLVLGEKYNPPQGKVNFGDLRRVTPINRKFGYDRGTPVDRYYVEKFLAQYASDIQGRVLEIGDNSYTKQFGGIAVKVSDVLHVHSENPQATIIGDLTNADNIPSNAFDCLVLTQTLHIIYDIRAALATIHRILKPGGVVLLTVPGISQISDDEWADYWCWSFTNLSIRRLFCEFFPDSNVEVNTHGNVLAATAFLQGITTEELQPQELDYRDAQYEMLICVRAVKPEVTV
ncbi:MAG: class I SAM-dependent methyltransferase [Scytonematopsis contorta HA4267-MV1]|jgi:SAM-dependent methyltransferase|nr:class I SAM-dependent methyltransferase [Scytonematopsis contorta HA4267-MV1]